MSGGAGFAGALTFAGAVVVAGAEPVDGAAGTGDGGSAGFVVGEGEGEGDADAEGAGTDVGVSAGSPRPVASGTACCTGRGRRPALAATAAPPSRPATPRAITDFVRNEAPCRRPDPAPAAWAPR